MKWKENGGMGNAREFALFSMPVSLSLTLAEVCDPEVRIKPLIWRPECGGRNTEQGEAIRAHVGDQR